MLSAPAKVKAAFSRRKFARGNQGRFWPAAILWPLIARPQDVGRPKISWYDMARSGKLRNAPLRAKVADLSPRFFKPGAIDVGSPQNATTKY
jgi:hypothetical protein